MDLCDRAVGDFVPAFGEHVEDIVRLTWPDAGGTFTATPRGSPLSMS
jgi:hypothetical protein